MNMQRVIAAIALIFTTVIVCWWLVTIPPWRESVFEPLHLAALAGAATVAALWVTFALGLRALRSERWLLAAFLAGMPLIYAARYFVAMDGKGPPAFGWLELLGIPLFVTLAWLGLKRSPWFLALGIAAHGLGWDMWHYGHSSYIPDWYSLGCLLLDVAIAVYAAARVPHQSHPASELPGHA